MTCFFKGKHFCCWAPTD